MEQLLRLKAIVKKEFRQVSRDIGTLGTLIILPLFLLALFGFAISLDVKNIKLAVRDRDRSRTSREYLTGFFNSSYFSFAAELSSPAEIDEALADGEVLATLTIPPGFGAAVDRGEKPAVQFLVDGSNSTTASTAIGYIQAADAAFSLKRAQKRALSLSRLRPAGTASSAAAPIAPPRSSVETRPRVVFNQELRSIDSLVPGLIVLILTLAAVVSTALALVREKEHGTMEQLAVSPIAPAELIIGKTLPYLLIALVSTALILVASRLLFGVVVHGSVPLLFAMTLLFLLCSLGVGILISSVVATQQAAFMIATMVTILPSFILSGFIFPIRNMPPVIQAITTLFPARWYLAILRAIMIKGAGFASFYTEAAILLVFAVAMLALGSARLSRSRS
jgi:ABC-2 type transport system permease protein